jgi:hypothetical protein
VYGAHTRYPQVGAQVFVVVPEFATIDVFRCQEQPLDADHQPAQLINAALQVALQLGEAGLEVPALVIQALSLGLAPVGIAGDEADGQNQTGNSQRHCQRLPQPPP